MDPPKLNIVSDDDAKVGEPEPKKPSSVPRTGSLSVTRKSRSQTLTGPQSKEDKRDILYYNFLKSSPGFSHVEEGFIMKDALTEYSAIFQNPDIQLKAGVDEITLPKGRYALFTQPTFAMRKFPDEISYKLPRQGWKIHISATEKGAIKVASAILPLLDQNLHLIQKRSGPPYNRAYAKIVASLPALRTLYYMTGSLKGDGRETQAGKLITFYPANKKHAVAMAKLFDSVLSSMKKAHILDDSDFYPLYGEALVGESGGVFVRYGNMSSAMDMILEPIYVPHKHRTPLRLLDPVEPTKKKGVPSVAMKESEESRVEFSENLLKDDRYRPWPDMMNKANVIWRDATDPFEGLNMRYIPHCGAKPITWEKRPDTWDKL